MAFDLKELILDGTKYESGYVNKDDDYVISASMVGKDPLQNYLSIIHGKVGEPEITDATLGTIFHLGMEQIVRNKVPEPGANFLGSEVSMHTKLSNGWVLSGTADLIVEQKPGRFEIHDYKLTKNYTRKMMMKERNSHDYTKQLQVLDALLRKNMHELGITKVIGDIELHCDFFLKDSKAINFEPVFNPFVAPNKNGTDDMSATMVLLNEVVAITDSLQAYIEAGQVPPMCADRWPRNVKGKIISTKCAFYCSHGKAGLCPHYQPGTRTNVDTFANW